MLEQREITTIQDKIAFLKASDTDHSLWIVPRLQNKHDLQRFYISSQGSLIGDPFKTTAEFWRELLLQCSPRLQVISTHSMQTFIKDTLQKQPEKWCHLQGTASIVFQILTHFLPILSHVEGPQLLSQWLQAHPVAQEKWGSYILLAMKIWRQIEGRFIIPAWIPSMILQALFLKDMHLSKTIIVDLNCDLLSTEMQVFKQLSRNNSIVILQPDEKWLKTYPNEFMAYLDESNSSDSVSQDTLVTHNTMARRFTSMLAEVKDAVGTVRHWIDQGIDIHKIVVTAPHIQTYWPVLRSYLDFEGIPYSQPLSTPLNTLPDVIEWLARIQIQIKPHAYFHTLTSAVFGGQNRSSHRLMDYEQFHQTYSRILNPSDYQRSQSIYQFISKDAISKDQRIDALSFLAYIQKFWQPSTKATDALEKVFQIFLEDSIYLPHLKPLEWLELLEQIISSTHLSVQDFSLHTLQIADLPVANKWFAQKIYILGLSQQGLKAQRPSLLSNADVLSLRSQLGFSLDLPERSPLEVHADLILSNPDTDKVISFAETDFMGRSLTPSLLWLKASPPQTTQTPYLTLWDVYQKKANCVKTAKQTFTRLKKWPQKHLDTTLQTLMRDQHLQEDALLPSYIVEKISVSGLENYHKCPFIFYAQDVLKLKSFPAFDMDVQALHQGLMIHELLAELTKEPFQPQRTDQELDSMIDHYLNKHPIVMESQFRKSFKELQREKLQSFLAFESQWRKQFPQTKIFLTEENIIGYIDPQSGQVSATQKDGYILLKGRLDRLDQVGTDLFSIIDYKLSFSQKTNYKTWLKNGEFQLGVYALMVKEGCLSGVTGEVVSAVYFGLKEMRRDKGFLLKEHDRVAHRLTTSYHQISKTGLQDFFKQLKEVLHQILVGIRRGDFQANPRDKTSCPSCPWRRICKAPHLT